MADQDQKRGLYDKYRVERLAEGPAGHDASDHERCGEECDFKALVERHFPPKRRADWADAYRERIAAWVKIAFGEEALTDRWERTARVVEEAIELAQAEGLVFNDVYKIADRVYSRPAGSVSQEAAGLMVCFLAWAAGTGTDLRAVTLTEIERIEQPEVTERIRAKQLEKAKAGTGRGYTAPLAEVAAQPQAQEGARVCCCTVVTVCGDSPRRMPNPKCGAHEEVERAYDEFVERENARKFPNGWATPSQEGACVWCGARPCQSWCSAAPSEPPRAAPLADGDVLVAAELTRAMGHLLNEAFAAPAQSAPTPAPGSPIPAATKEEE